MIAVMILDIYENALSFPLKKKKESFFLLCTYYNGILMKGYFVSVVKA